MPTVERETPSVRQVVGSRKAGNGTLQGKRVAAAFVVALLASAAGCRADSEPAAPDEVDRCEPEGSPEVVEGEQSLEAGGEMRRYLVSLPEDYDGATPQPLLLSFHGWSLNKEIHEDYTTLAKEGTARGYVVVTPDALGEPSDWNYLADPARVDDFAFVGALVDELSQSLCIEEGRVFAAGHSAGSAFAGFLVCRDPGRYSGVAMVAAFIPPSCPADEASPSALAFHGTADPLVPFEGGGVSGGPVQIPAALDTLGAYADASRCGPAVVDEPAPGVERHRLTDCAHERQVELYVVENGGHGWPGAEPPWSDDPGELSATNVILDFFDGIQPPT